MITALLFAGAYLLVGILVLLGYFFAEGYTGGYIDGYDLWDPPMHISFVLLWPLILIAALWQKGLSSLKPQLYLSDLFGFFYDLGRKARRKKLNKGKSVAS